MEHRRTIQATAFRPHLRNSSPFTCHVSRVAKEINLQKCRNYCVVVSGKICAVSRLTAPVSSYKRAVFARVSHVVHRKTCGLWLEPLPMDYILDYPPVNRAVLRT